MGVKGAQSSSRDGGSASLGASSDALLLEAINAGEARWETGRSLVTFKEGETDAGIEELATGGLNVADAQDVDFLGVSALDDAGALVFREIGVALVASDTAQALDVTGRSPVFSREDEVFVFAADSGLEGYQQTHAGTADSGLSEYFRGFLGAATAIRRDIAGGALPAAEEAELEFLLSATWGLTACQVPPSASSGAGIKVAVLDTGDLGHPDIPAARIGGQRSFVVGQEVQDLHGHGTHCVGTACGPKSPPVSTPRYGIAYESSIYIGKVLSNTGSGTQAQVLAGMNWAIAEGCHVISMSLGSSSPVSAAYTAAGRAALDRGCLIVAAAGNSAPNPTGSPANSPTVMSVASLDKDLRLSSFTQRGKIDIAGPGRDVYSSVPMPTRYGTKSGTSMATPHVAGCAALWAQTSPNLRGLSLWRKLAETARQLPLPASQVGAGLVQAPP
jgi:subtilisin family serine protease